MAAAGPRINAITPICNGTPPLLLDNALAALTIVFDPARFAIICLGIVLGLVIGMMPGIGGLGGLALLIPSPMQWMPTRRSPS